MASSNGPKNLSGYVESFEETKDPEVLMDLKRKLAGASEEEKNQLRTDLASKKTEAGPDEITASRPDIDMNVEEKPAQPEEKQFDKKEFSKKINEYNRTLENLKTIKQEIQVSMSEVGFSTKTEQNGNEYMPSASRTTTDSVPGNQYDPKTSRISNSQILRIQGFQEEEDIIKNALAEKGNKIKADALVYFEGATTDDELEKRREKLQHMITDEDLRHDALHGFTIEMFKRHPEKMNPSKGAQKPAEKIVPTPLEKLIPSEPRIQPKVEPVQPAPPKPADQITIDNPRVDKAIDDSFMVKGQEKNPRDAAQAIFATDEDAYDDIKEAELKAAQQMDSSAPDLKKPAGEEKPAADRVSGGQFEVKPTDEKKDEAVATLPKQPPMQPPIQPTAAENSLAEKKTTEPVAQPKGILKVNPDGTLIAEKVEPVAQNLSPNQNAATNQYATETKPGNPAEARIAEIKQSLQDNQLPDNLNAGKSALPEITKPEPIVEPVEKQTLDTSSKTEIEPQKPAPTTPDDNLTVDKVEPALPGIPPVAPPTETQAVSPTPAPTPEKKKGLLGRIFGTFLREKDPDADAAATLEKGKVEVSAVESQSKSE